MAAMTPLRRFVLGVLAWLPVCFFFWWWAAALWVWPPVHLAGPLLTHLWPDLVASVGQHGAEMEVVTRLVVQQAGAGGRLAAGEIVLTPNPMIYGYALPLYVALVLATPLAEDRRWRQLLLGLAALWPAQAFGLVAETLKLLAFDSGAEGAAAVQAAGLGRELIALAYQFGYLVLPAVLPPLLWLAQNRAFTDSLTGRGAAEPAPGGTGPS